VAALAANWAGFGRPAGAAPQERAQDHPLRVVVANVPRIIAETRENVDFDETFRAEKEKLAADNARMQDQIRDVQSRAGNFRPDSPQYDDLQRQYVEAYSKWKVWGESNSMDREMRRKKHLRVMNDKVSAAVAEYAAREGIDLVIADVQPVLNEKQWAQVPPEQVESVIAQRRVLFSGKSLDVSDAIIALLDSKYRARGVPKAPGAAAPGKGPG
jgi:hypothetical protein